MFNIGAIGNGSPGMNCVSMIIMQSQQDTDMAIRELENAVKAGYSPNIAFSQVLDRCGVQEKNLTDFDKQRLRRKVEQMSKYKSLGR